jgi:hypothetical protein
MYGLWSSLQQSYFSAIHWNSCFTAAGQPQPKGASFDKEKTEGKKMFSWNHQKRPTEKEKDDDNK